MLTFLSQRYILIPNKLNTEDSILEYFMVYYLGAPIKKL